MTKKQRFDRRVEQYRKAFPTPFPVKAGLTRKLDRNWYGITTRRGRTLYILVDARLKWSDITEVLIHEWAHAMVWRHERVERRRPEDHDDEWGLAYAKVYRFTPDLPEAK